MPPFINRMVIVADVLSKLALALAAIGLIAMTIFIAAQVIFRYIFNDSLIWSEPASILVMGWFIFLGAAVGIREGYHLSFDILLYFLPEHIKPWLFSIVDSVVMAFGCGMAWYGIKLAIKTSANTLPILGISGAFSFLSLITGGVLIVLFSLERLLLRIFDAKTDARAIAPSTEKMTDDFMG